MGKSAPSAPDPYQSAGAQYQYGTEAAAFNKALNATNTYGPTGSTTNQITGYDPVTGAPQYAQVTSLTAPEQQLLTGQQKGGLTEQGIGQNQAAQLNAITGQPLYSTGPAAKINTTLNTSNVPGLPSGASLDQLGDTAYSKALAGNMAAIEPSLDNREEQLKAQLVNSGNGPGTPAYDNAMREFSAQRASAEAQAGGQAVTTGSGVENQRYNEAANSNSQIYGQDLNTLVAQNQAAGMSQDAAIKAAQSQIEQRSSIANLINGLFGGSSVQIPGSAGLPSASTATPDIMSAFQNAYTGQVAQYNANAGTTDAALGTAATIAAAVI